MKCAVISLQVSSVWFLTVLVSGCYEGVQRLCEERPRTVANFDHASTDGFLCLKSSRLPGSWDYICLSDQASENHLGTNARPSMNLGPFSNRPLSRLGSSIPTIYSPHSKCFILKYIPWNSMPSADPWPVTNYHGPDEGNRRL